MSDLADYYSLTRAERDLFVAVAQYNDADHTPAGTDVADRVQELRGGQNRPHNTTVYSALDELQAAGLVDCEKVNPKRNVYTVTTYGRDVLDAVADELPARH